MKTSFKQALLCGILVLNFQLFSQALGYDNHRIAISADGNNQPDNHPEAQWPRADPDDWGGTPTTLAILAKSKLKGQLVHYSYNNFIDAPLHTNERNYMKEAVEGAIERWGFDQTRFFDVSEDSTPAINHLVEELKNSTASNPLYFIHMGPSEFFYRAVEKVVADGSIGVLAYVQVISHSGYNDNHLRRNAHHTMAETIALSGNRIRYKKITDQNSCNNPDEKWCSTGNFVPYHWMRDHITEDMRWLWSRLQFSGNRGADVSDAGMVWYLLNDDEFGNPLKLQRFIGDGIITTPCQDFNYNGIQDFEMSKVGDFVIAYKDTSRNAVAVNAGIYQNRFGATQKIFNGPTGNYNISLTTLTEEDGESTYRLRVDGQLVGEFQNPEVGSEGDMQPHIHIFENVALAKGDVFIIESNTNTNGKIPEGNGTAWARGRWRSVDFQCLEVTANDSEDTGEDCVPEEINNILIFEAERFQLNGGWKVGSDTGKASGGKFIYYSGPNLYNRPFDVHNISQTFKINNPGVYTFKWYMRQPDDETGTDLGNDAWFYFSDNIGSGFFNGERKVLETFRKFVGRSTKDFVLNGAVELNHKQSWVQVTFPTAGEYTLNLSGRSHGFELDRIVLYKGVSFEDLPDSIADIKETTSCGVVKPPIPIIVEKINFINPPETMYNESSTLSFNVSYTASIKRHINVEIKEHPNATYVKNARIEASKGDGEGTVDIVLDAPLEDGKKYDAILSLRLFNGTWRDNIIKKVHTFTADKNALSLNAIDRKQLGVKVYPNFFSKSLFIDNPTNYKIDSIDIFNVIGETVYRHQINKKESSIDLSSFAVNAASGVYFIRLLMLDEVFVFKVIKS